MSFEGQGKGAVQREAIEGGPSACVGIPTVNVATNQVALYYDMEPPSFWRRIRVFFRGLTYGLTLLLCCRAVKLTSDDLTWGRRLFTIGTLIGSALVGVGIGFLSVYLGCWIGSEVAVSVGADDNDRTGCSVGGWSCLALCICYVIIVSVRTIPKPVFRNASSLLTNSEDPLAEPSENR